MSEWRARAVPVALNDPTNVTAVGIGAVVAGVLMVCLLRPEIGRYTSDGIAMVCALGAAGMAIFVATLPATLDIGAPLRRPATVLAVVGFAAALATMPFAVMTVSGDGIRGLGNGLARSVALRSGDYEAVVARATGLVLVAWAIGTHTTRRSRVLLVSGALIVVGSFLLTGHVRTHGPEAAVIATALGHVAAAATWFGGLVALGIALRHRRDDVLTCGRLLAGFARAMTAVLSLLLAGGVGFAVLYLPSVSALVHTAYGDVLLVKLAVVATALVLSAANHHRLVPAARTGNATAVRVLRANIAAEQVLLVAVLVITEVLMRQNPGG